MIFQFPDLETFRFAVTSAQVPPEVSGAPAEVAFDSEGRPSVRSAAGIPPRTMQNALKKLGVKSAKEHYSEAILTVDCWPQVLPVTKTSTVPEITSNTPVLFEMPASELAAVVTEMLRLGNDRQSFRTIAPVSGAGERVLLKVIGPPYYTLLRAIDKSTQQGANVVAYIERAPRVWVEIGYEHPLAGQIKPAEGQVLLLRPERDWTVVEEGPFQDVYEVLHFQLPAASVEWQESQLKGKLAVPLRLAPGNAADVAEMWVITEDAVNQLDALVRDADERLMARLSFAVASDNGQTTIVLKTRPSRLEPPVVSLTNAVPFKPYWKLPNLFLPVGKRLMPTLRRDAVRKLLADDPAQVVWLMPGADGKFTPEILPDDAFQPLENWIDYVIDHDHETLATWINTTRFDFDSFVCTDEQPDKPKSPPADKAKKPKKVRDESRAEDTGAALTTPKGTKRKAVESDEADFAVPLEVVAPSEVKQRLRDLEQQFVEFEGPLDSPERQAIWPEMAKLNAIDGRELEAAICWTNAFWELPEVPVEGSWSWLYGEDSHAHKIPTAEEFDAALGARDQSPTDVRRLAARAVHACRLNPVPESLLKRLPRIREYLDRYDNVLGVRAAWLAWWHVVRAGGQTDVLALARVRDRLLQRLLAEGLNKERDLPFFLRTAGEQNSDRLRLIRDRAMTVQKLVEKWHAKEADRSPQFESAKPLEVNKPYVDLLFAFGMAKLGEHTRARELMSAAEERLLAPKGPNSKPEPAHEFLFRAFAWRIDNAIQGKPHTGQLPTPMLSELATIDKDHQGKGVNPGYIVSRLRSDLWVLDPQDKQDPYAERKASGTGVIKKLAQMALIHEPRRLAEELKSLIRSNLAIDDRLEVFDKGLGLAPRVGQDFVVSLIQEVPALIESTTRNAGPKEAATKIADLQRKVLARALYLATHYDQPELVQALFQSFLDYLKSRSDQDRHSAINKVARECMRSLRKAGLRDEIDVFLKQVVELVVRNRSLVQLRAEARGDWYEVLTSLLSIAEGWLFFGGYDQAKLFLDEAQNTILHQPMATGKVQNYFDLVRAYIAAIGQGPIDECLDRIDELFRGIARLPNTQSPSPYYSRLHLMIVEDVVRSLISENIIFGDQARRWLDEDEYLVRRRIHGDMKRLLVQSGL